MRCRRRRAGGWAPAPGRAETAAGPCARWTPRWGAPARAAHAPRGGPNRPAPPPPPPRRCRTERALQGAAGQGRGFTTRGRHPLLPGQARAAAQAMPASTAASWRCSTPEPSQDGPAPSHRSVAALHGLRRGGAPRVRDGAVPRRWGACVLRHVFGPAGRMLQNGAVMQPGGPPTAAAGHALGLKGE